MSGWSERPRAPHPPLQGSPSMIVGHIWILSFLLVFTHSPPPSSHGAFISTDQAFKKRHSPVSSYASED